jgi:hypothetical protein
MPSRKARYPPSGAGFAFDQDGGGLRIGGKERQPVQLRHLLGTAEKVVERVFLSICVLEIFNLPDLYFVRSYKKRVGLSGKKDILIFLIRLPPPRHSCVIG